MSQTDIFSSLDESTKRRLLHIAAYQGVPVDYLMRAAISEAALNYFRNRKDDPANIV